MAAVGSVVIGVGAATADFERGMLSARKTGGAAVEGIAADVDKAMSRVQKSLDSTASRVGALLKIEQLKTFAAPIVEGFVSVIKGASDLNETLSKVGTVFGPAAGQVEAQADQMAKAFGLPKAAMLDAASMFGLIAQGAGKTQAESALLGNRFTKLAADVASFHNLDMPTALEKIRAGLSGEAEPLKALGAGFTEAEVKAKALSMGLVKAAGDLDEQSKFTARAALITEKLSVASGDLEKTQGGAANQFRKISGTIENMGTSIGTTLLPAIQAVLPAISGVVEGISAFAEANKGTLAASFGQVIDVVGQLAEGGAKIGAALLPAIQAAVPAVLSVVEGVASFAAQLAGPLAEAFGGVAGVAGQLVGVAGMVLAAFRPLGPLIAGAFNIAAKAINFVLMPITKLLAAVKQGLDWIGLGPTASALPSGMGKGLADAMSPAAAGQAAPSAAAKPAAGVMTPGGSDASTKTIDALKKEAATFGMTADQVKIYEMRLAGATEAQIAEARALAKQIEGMKGAKKAREDLDKAAEKRRKDTEDAEKKHRETMQQDAKSIVESTRTPMEKAAVEQGKLDGLKAAGLLGAEAHDRATRKNLGDAMGESKGPRFAGAMELGSTEARSAILRGTSGNGSGEKIQMDQLTTLREMLRELKGEGKRPKPIPETFEF